MVWTRRKPSLLLWYDDWSDPRIRSVWQDVGHSKQPFIALYSPYGPPVALDPYSLERLEVSHNR
jgi:hypothetical protein